MPFRLKGSSRRVVTPMRALLALLASALRPPAAPASGVRPAELVRSAPSGGLPRGARPAPLRAGLPRMTAEPTVTFRRAPC